LRRFFLEGRCDHARSRASQEESILNELDWRPCAPALDLIGEASAGIEGDQLQSSGLKTPDARIRFPLSGEIRNWPLEVRDESGFRSQ
jgi:hypothetical protein